MKKKLMIDVVETENSDVGCARVGMCRVKSRMI